MVLKIGDLVTPVTLCESSKEGYSKKDAVIGIVVGEIDWYLDDDHQGRMQRRYEIKFPDAMQCTYWNEEELIVILESKMK
jgi:hypothetical protein